MSEVIVSIDRIVIDFTHVHWNFFNGFHYRICQFFGVKMNVRRKGFQYHININTDARLKSRHGEPRMS